MVSQIPMAKGAFWGADEPSRGGVALLGVSRFSSETLLGARRFWATALLGARRFWGTRDAGRHLSVADSVTNLPSGENMTPQRGFLMESRTRWVLRRENGAQGPSLYEISSETHPLASESRRRLSFVYSPYEKVTVGVKLPSLSRH